MLNVKVRYETRHYGEMAYDAMLINIVHVHGEGYKAIVFVDGDISVVDADNLVNFAEGDL